MSAAMRARESAATAIRTIAATRANQKAQACNRPRSRGTTSSRANSSGVPTRTNYPPGADPMCAGSHFAEQALLLDLEFGFGDQALLAQLAEFLDTRDRILAFARRGCGIRPRAGCSRRGCSRRGWQRRGCGCPGSAPAHADLLQRLRER